MSVMDKYRYMTQEILSQTADNRKLLQIRQNQQNLISSINEQVVFSSAPFVFRADLSKQLSLLQSHNFQLQQKLDHFISRNVKFQRKNEAFEEKCRFAVADSILTGLKEQLLVQQHVNKKLHDKLYAQESELYEANMEWKRARKSNKVVTREQILDQCYQIRERMEIEIQRLDQEINDANQTIQEKQ